MSSARASHSPVSHSRVSQVGCPRRAGLPGRTQTTRYLQPTEVSHRSTIDQTSQRRSGSAGCTGVVLRAALAASCLRGARPPVDLAAVCLVRAMAVRGLNQTGWPVSDSMRLASDKPEPRRGRAGASGAAGKCLEWCSLELMVCVVCWSTDIEPSALAGRVEVASR